MSFRNTLTDITNAQANLSSVHSEATLPALYAETTIVWHVGDVGIVSDGLDVGTYVYLGTTSGSPRTGTTVAADWVKLSTPDVAINSVAGLTGTITAPQLRTAINVGDGADVTPANGVYLDPTSGTAGQVAKINAAGTAWEIADDESGDVQINLTDTSTATQITIAATGTGTDAVLTAANGSNAGIVTAANFTAWEAKLGGVALTKAIGAATTVASKTVYNAVSDFGLSTGSEVNPHHRLTYNGLTLNNGTDYNVITPSAETVTDAGINAGPSSTTASFGNNFYVVPGTTTRDAVLAAISVGDVLQIGTDTTNRATVGVIQTDVSEGAVVVTSEAGTGTWDTTGLTFGSPADVFIVTTSTGSGGAEIVLTAATAGALEVGGTNTLVLENTVVTTS